MRMAAISLDLEEEERAARLLGAAEAMLDGLGAYLASDQGDYYERALLASPGARLNGDAWAAGGDVGLEGAIALVQSASMGWS
jgi:hypothetical protein